MNVAIDTADQGQQAPIFVVGAPRSGTTLLAALLASHSRLSCGPETHFFRYLPKRPLRRLCRPSTWPRSAVDYLYSITQPGSPIPHNFGLSRSEITRYLTERRPSLAAVLGSLTEQDMLRAAKRRWVEKTPEHLLHLEEIRQNFPDAYIVRIVRDPRDIALSWQKTWKQRSFLEVLARLRQYDEASHAFFMADPRCFTLRYEDLVTEPAEELRRLCDFIGEDFEPAMLNTRESIKRINSIGEPWKEKAGTSIDPTRARAWRRHLHPADNMRAQAVVGDWLNAYGYEAEEEFSAYAEVRPAISSLARYKELRPLLHSVVTSLADAGFRLWSRAPSEIPRLAVYLGDPGRHWLGSGKWARCRNTLRRAREIVATKQRTAVFWVNHGQNGAGHVGKCGSLLGWLLRKHRVETLPVPAKQGKEAETSIPAA